MSPGAAIGEVGGCRLFTKILWLARYPARV